MARSGAGRGTRMGRGVLSGTTIKRIPSGVTLDAGGFGYSSGTFVTPTELGYLDGAAGYVLSGNTAGLKWSHGLMDHANNRSTGVSKALTVDTGLTTIYFANSTLYSTLGTSCNVSEMLTHWSGGDVTTYCFYAGADATIALGVSVAWFAIGA